ncbi:MAG: hypothetical protein IOD12_08850 [Silvanigrellales bacterium]|nr:hypothetical protein [Silvanigrellales bacterium]
MNSHSASAPASSPTEPPHRTVHNRFQSRLRSVGLALCPAAASLTLVPANGVLASPASGNFTHLVSTTASTSNFVVIRSFAKGALTSSAQAASGQGSGAAERVELDAGALSSFVAAHKLALRPVFLHFSSMASQKERQSVIGLRGNEVWRYDLGSAAPSRRISRLGISVSLSESLRAEHESAVVDSKVILAYQPTIDLPNGDAATEAGAPVYSFVRNGKALYQVNRSGEGSFTITQIGVVEDSQ